MDEKGVSSIVGFIIVIFIVTSFVGYYEGSIVPNLNENAEIRGLDNTETDIKEIPSAVQSTSTTGVPRTVNIDTSVRYPPQFAEPFRSGATVRYRSPDPTAVRLNNSNISVGSRDFDSQYQRITIDYVFIDPTTFGYENGNLYADNEGNTSTLQSGFIPSNKTFYVPELSDGTDTTARSPSITYASSDASVDRIDFTGEGSGDALELVIRTRLEKQTWNTIIDPYFGQGEMIQGFTYNPNTPYNKVTLTLDDRLNYTIIRPRASIN